ncbi:hypothetical protein Tco_0017530, partial [Tanacetum coccineum]
MVVVLVDFLCEGTEDGGNCVFCDSVCELLFDSSDEVVLFVLVSSDKVVFGSVFVVKGMFGSGSVVEVVCCLVCFRLVSSVMMIGGEFGVKGIGVE